MNQTVSDYKHEPTLMSPFAVALGFWAADYWGRSTILLVAWVAAFALIRGVRDIVLAFRVREIQHGATHGLAARPRAQAAATS